MNNQYKHAGEPFTAKIAEELILELCGGETLEKQDIMKRVYHDHHLKRGGSEYANPKTLNQCFNDALNRRLKQRGLANNKSRGNWTIYSESPPDNPPDEPTEGCVYIYYYPAYKELAEFKDEDKYPCKIGSTRRDAEIRIKEQQTGMPERAMEEVVMDTDDPKGLEQMIRSILKRKGMHIQEAPGDEWYLINSEIAKQVAEAFEAFQKSLDFI